MCCERPEYSHRLGAVSWRDGAGARGGILARLRGLLQYRKLKKTLTCCPLFDAAYYLQNDPVLAASGREPLLHYCTRGVFEGRNPNPYFFTAWYLTEYPEVAASGMNPLLHYIEKGAAQGANPNPYFFGAWYRDEHPKAAAANPLLHYIREGAASGFWPNPCFDPDWYARTYPQSAGQEPLAHFLAHGPEFCFQPNPHFDGVWYLKQYPEAAATGLHPFQHFLYYGPAQSCDPGPLFASRWYGEERPEALAGGMPPLAHYLRHREKEAVNPNPYFDARWYLETYPEVAKAGLDPVLHYGIFGVKERRDPGPWFSTDWYLWKYPDVAALAMNPLEHYLRVGAAEGRDPGPFFDSVWYLTQCPEAANSGLPPLLHFLRFGQKAGSQPYNPAEHARRGNRYAAWRDIFFALGEEDRGVMRRHIADFAEKPLISLVMPVFNPEPAFLEASIASVRGQIYPHWELCIADDASTDPRIAEILRRAQAEDSRVKIVFRPENGHISKASNSALALATGEFVGLLDHDDELTEDALFWVVEALRRHPDAGVLYSDEDKIDAQGLPQEPYFKSDWDPFLFCGHNLITHLGVYRRSLLVEIGGFREGFEGSQDYDLAARAVERLEPGQIVHIPRVLYHWRMSAGSTATSVAEKPYARAAALKAVNEHLERLKLPARVETAPGSAQLLTCRAAAPPLVSIIIPTRNHADLVKTCIDSIRAKTDYPKYEIILVDNGSDESSALACFAELAETGAVRLLRDDGPFNFSRLNNAAVAAARGEVVVLLNNDTEVTAPDWLAEMVGLALLPGVGAVGAKLLFSDGTVQHAGVTLGVQGGAVHAYKEFPGEAPGYWKQLRLARGYSALTGACLAARKSLYEAVGGLDEALLPVGYNDIDFCLKLRESGLRNLWTPRALLFHHESRSRGEDDKPEKKRRFWNEFSLLKKRWPHVWYHDPAYNPNLTFSKIDFERTMQPRVLLNARHWPAPFAPSYVAPESSGLRLLLVLPSGRERRILAFARALLRQGLIRSYAAADAVSFFEVSEAADGWFDAICLAGAPWRLMWFERCLMKFLPFLIDVDSAADFAPAPALELDNPIFQSLVHAAALTAPDAAPIAELEALYGLNLSGCSEVVADDAAGQFLACLERVRLAEPLPACRIRFF